MCHVLDRIDRGDKHSSGNEKPEEKGQGIHFHRDADGVAAGRNTVTHPVGNNLAIHHDRLNKGDHAGKGDGDGQNCNNAAKGLILPQDNNQKRTQEQNHNRVDREMDIIHEITHPCSLLISLVSSVP